MVVAIQKDPDRNFAPFSTDQSVNLCPENNINVGNFNNTGHLAWHVFYQ
jgi:hypothetical protein